MPTAVGGYYINGTRVPSVTTVISRFKESGGLIHWAWDLGRQGKDYRDERDKAADAGTIAHALVEAHINLQPEPDLSKYPEDVVSRGRQAFGAYLQWERHTRVSVVATEMSMVSERFRYGGTPDAIGEIDEQLCLLDWKSSNAVYGEQMIPQLAAYKQLWEENHPDRPITGGAHLCRFSKDSGDFAHHYFADISDGWTAFERMRELYDLVARLKKRA